MPLRTNACKFGIMFGRGKRREGAGGGGGWGGWGGGADMVVCGCTALHDAHSAETRDRAWATCGRAMTAGDTMDGSQPDNIKSCRVVGGE